MGLVLPPGYRLRAATTADSAAVRSLIFSVLEEYGLSPDPDGADADLGDLEGSYAKVGGWFAVVTDSDGTIVGSAGLMPLGTGVVELRKMYLAKAHRGRGLGKALLAAALSEARSRRFTKVTLETASVLKEAIALYERHGFRLRPDVPHVCRCDRVMELELAGGRFKNTPGQGTQPTHPRFHLG